MMMTIDAENHRGGDDVLGQTANMVGGSVNNNTNTQNTTLHTKFQTISGAAPLYKKSVSLTRSNGKDRMNS